MVYSSAKVFRAPFPSQRNSQVMVSSSLLIHGRGLEPWQSCIMFWAESVLPLLGTMEGGKVFGKLLPQPSVPSQQGPFFSWGWKNSHGSPRQKMTGHVKTCLYIQKTHAVLHVCGRAAPPFLALIAQKHEAKRLHNCHLFAVSPQCLLSPVLAPRHKERGP